MVERDINYLLNKYPPNKKAVGEIWSRETEVKKVKEYRTNQRYFLFDALNSQQLKLQGTTKHIAKELIKTLDFNKFGTKDEKTIILMIMLYCKLQEDKRVQHYSNFFEKNNITPYSFINFLIQLQHQL